MIGNVVVDVVAFLDFSYDAIAVAPVHSERRACFRLSVYNHIRSVPEQILPLG
jgi:hypothetical protein